MSRFILTNIIDWRLNLIICKIQKTINDNVVLMSSVKFKWSVFVFSVVYFIWLYCRSLQLEPKERSVCSAYVLAVFVYCYCIYSLFIYIVENRVYGYISPIQHLYFSSETSSFMFTLTYQGPGCGPFPDPRSTAGCSRPTLSTFQQDTWVWAQTDCVSPASSPRWHCGQAYRVTQKCQGCHGDL